MRITTEQVLQSVERDVNSRVVSLVTMTSVRNSLPMRYSSYPPGQIHVVRSGSGPSSQLLPQPNLLPQLALNLVRGSLLAQGLKRMNHCLSISLIRYQESAVAKVERLVTSVKRKVNDQRSTINVLGTVNRETVQYVVSQGSSQCL